MQVGQWIFASSLMGLAVSGPVIAQEAPVAAKERTFVEKLVIDPAETCARGAPKAGDVVALALRGAKGSNYMLAGRNAEARLAVRGPVIDEYSVFQITETATENTIAFYSLGQLKFLTLDAETRVSATAEPAAAVPFVFEETGDGYVRIRLPGHSVYMRMNQNGYLDFRTRNVAAAVQFCAQDVVAD